MLHPLSDKCPIPISQLYLVNTDVPAGVGAPPLDTTAEQLAIATDKASAPEHAPEIADPQRPESVQTPPRRYPHRQRHPPERFHDLTW